jgi:hypothetical protein
LGGVDRDRLTLGDVSKRDVTAPVEVLEAGGLVGVIDEPRRRRVEVAAAAVAVHEQVLTNGQREVLSLVDLLKIEGDHGLAGDEVSIGVDTFARKVYVADPDIGHSQRLLTRAPVTGLHPSSQRSSTSWLPISSCAPTRTTGTLGNGEPFGAVDSSRERTHLRRPDTIQKGHSDH